MNFKIEPITTDQVLGQFEITLKILPIKDLKGQNNLKVEPIKSLIGLENAQERTDKVLDLFKIMLKNEPIKYFISLK